jgi:hypothetical protein
MKIFLDDIRNPPDDSWILVRSWDEAVGFVQKYGIPQEVSFDHDLGINEETGEVAKTGMAFAKYLVNLDLDTDEMPIDFKFVVHSANPIGRDNITFLLNKYLEIKKK